MNQRMNRIITNCVPAAETVKRMAEIQLITKTKNQEFANIISERESFWTKMKSNANTGKIAVDPRINNITSFVDHFGVPIELLFGDRDLFDQHPLMVEARREEEKKKEQERKAKWEREKKERMAQEKQLEFDRRQIQQQEKAKAAATASADAIRIAYYKAEIAKLENPKRSTR